MLHVNDLTSEIRKKQNTHITIAYAISTEKTTTEIKSTFECNMHEMLELPFRYLQTKVSSFQKV